MNGTVIRSTYDNSLWNQKFDYSVESQDKEESIIRQTMTGTIGEYLRLRLAVFRRS